MAAQAASLGRREELRQRLVLAAEAIIEAHGPSGVKARPLADMAECALGAIYTVFPDLDALILAVGGRVLARLDAHLAPILVPPAGEQMTREAARRRLIDFGLAYLDFAFAHRTSWRALFEHRAANGKDVDGWTVADQSRLFGKVETLLEPLLPNMQSEERALLARSLFSAVHGVVSLGLDEKLARLSVGTLIAQVTKTVTALAEGIEESER